MPRSGSVLCFSERRRKRDRALLVLSSEKLRADPIEARRPDLRGVLSMSESAAAGLADRSSGPLERSHSLSRRPLTPALSPCCAGGEGDAPASSTAPPGSLPRRG